MKCITLKQFCNELGFYPNSAHNLSDFAKLTGISVSYISKLYNARPVGSNGPKWNKLCEYVERHGYQLITANPTDYMQSNLLKENKRLNKKIRALEQEIAILKSQQEIYAAFDSLCKSYMDNKDRLDELRFSVRPKKHNRKEVK